MGNAGLTRRDYSFPLMKAIFARLDANKPQDLQGNDVPVCDFISKDQGFPYVEIGITEHISNWDCKQEAGGMILATIRVWDNQALNVGMKNINKIAGEVLNTLTATDLDLSADGLRVGRYDIQGSNINTKEENGIISRIMNIVYFITDETTVQV